MENTVANALYTQNTGTLRTAFANYCPTAPECDDASIRLVLSQFAANCPPDYVVSSGGQNMSIQAVAYQVYSANLLSDQMCIQNEAGEYCQIDGYVALARGAANETQLNSNMQNFADNKEFLCSDCTKQSEIMAINYTYAHPPGTYPFISEEYIRNAQQSAIDLLKSSCGEDLSTIPFGNASAPVVLNSATSTSTETPSSVISPPPNSSSPAQNSANALDSALAHNSALAWLVGSWLLLAVVGKL